MDDIDSQKIAEAYEGIDEGLINRLKARLAQGSAAVGNAANIAKGAAVMGAGKLAQAAGSKEQGQQIVDQGKQQVNAASAQAIEAKKESIKNAIMASVQKTVQDGFGDMVKLNIVKPEFASQAAQYVSSQVEKVLKHV